MRKPHRLHRSVWLSEAAEQQIAAIADRDNKHRGEVRRELIEWALKQKEWRTNEN